MTHPSVVRLRHFGKTLDLDETLTFTIASGKFTHVEETHSDEAAYDAFWS